GRTGDRLDATQLDAKLTGNRFAGVHLMPPVLTLPPNTKFAVKIPSEKNDGELRFTNNGFFDVIIETSCVGGDPGLGRSDSFFRKPQSQQQSPYKFVTFTIKVTANFSEWRSGHPKMAPFRDWVNAVVEVLRNGFDDERAWIRMRDTVIL